MKCGTYVSLCSGLSFSLPKIVSAVVDDIGETAKFTALMYIQWPIHDHNSNQSITANMSFGSKCSQKVIIKSLENWNNFTALNIDWLVGRGGSCRSCGDDDDDDHHHIDNGGSIDENVAATHLDNQPKSPSCILLPRLNTRWTQMKEEIMTTTTTNDLVIRLDPQLICSTHRSFDHSINGSNSWQ